MSPETLNIRQREILGLAGHRGFVSVDILATRFGVTTQTIRRDINQLCDGGMMQRFHGGASIASSVENLAYDTRQIIEAEAKRAIAAEVARHLPEHASLFINIGTTTEGVAEALAGHAGLRVITNNLNVANMLGGNPDFEVIIAGGAVRPRDKAVTGEATIDFINQFHVDFAIIGISGIDADGSLLDFDYAEVRVAQAIMANARKTFLCADHSKFGRTAMVRLGHVREIDALFTDRAPPAALMAVLREAGTDVHLPRGEERANV